MTETRDMCKKLETLPGVLVNYWPLGIEGLSKIDDKYVQLSEPEEEGGAPSRGPAPVSAVQPSSAPVAHAPAQAPMPEEGGEDEGGVASGMDASD